MMNIKLIEKLWEKTQLKDGHWLWTGATSNGHGRCSYNGTLWTVSRLSLCIYLKISYKGIWEACHICEYANCWNPLHLYQGDRKSNTNDNINNGKFYYYSKNNSNKTHCLNGHPYFGNNLYIKPNGWRVCIICRTEQKRKLRQRDRKLGLEVK
jgi:hypothetical protein